jgi:hypothetical protein
MNATAQPNFFNVVISRQQIESGDVSSVLSVLSELLYKEAAIHYREMVDVAVQGYDANPRELTELPEVRDFVKKLDEEFPYWCYFLSKRTAGLMFILSCLSTPYRSPEASDPAWRNSIAEYLTQRGLPAMNALCETVECSEPEIVRLTERITNYIVKGVDIS